MPKKAVLAFSPDKVLFENARNKRALSEGSQAVTPSVRNGMNNRATEARKQLIEWYAKKL